MAFCANCGNKVGENDKFCASCGATRVPAQAAAPPPPPPPQPQYQPPPQQPPPQYQQQGYVPPPGSPQPGMQPMGMAQGDAGASSTGLQANVAGLLCYLGWWVTGIIFLLLEKKSQFVRFNAAQSIVVLGAINLVAVVLGYVPHLDWLGGLVGFAGVVLMIILMVKAYQGQMYRIPIAANIADGLAGKVQM
jgi:uncharacterized membrane protein